ncbi:suppressor protein SRP40 [Drosophila grimshawi]|uniref:GH11866 n=1 Tax=Drosophila grimshawi TaxID=7222 RepID=B4JLI0_DROGR|nr:suppressor protein SRP40 [Drosophila grimshawi]EDW00433.1 GH11866 [Drosophila grimshawi]
MPSKSKRNNEQAMKKRKVEKGGGGKPSSEKKRRSSSSSSGSSISDRYSSRSCTSDSSYDSTSTDSQSVSTDEEKPSHRTRHCKSIRQSKCNRVVGSGLYKTKVPELLVPSPSLTPVRKTVSTKMAAAATTSMPDPAALETWSPMPSNSKKSKSMKKRKGRAASPTQKLNEKKSVTAVPNTKYQKPQKAPEATTPKGKKERQIPSAKKAKENEPHPISSGKGHRSPTRPVETSENKNNRHTTLCSADIHKNSRAKHSTSQGKVKDAKRSEKHPSTHAVAKPKIRENESSTWHSTSRARDKVMTSSSSHSSTRARDTELQQMLFHAITVPKEIILDQHSPEPVCPSSKPYFEDVRRDVRSASRTRQWRSSSRPAHRDGDRRSPSGQRDRIRYRDRRSRYSPTRSYEFSRSQIAERQRTVRLHIHGLSPHVTKTHIFNIFNSFGPVISVDFPYKRNEFGFAGRGYAFVEFENPEDCEIAQKTMNGGKIDDQRISVTAFDQNLLRYPWRPRF